MAGLDEEGGDGRAGAREVIGSLLETGDKAKTEMVRMVAREVRAYLEELKIGQDVMHLLTNYSLEVHASFNLSPLAEDRKPASDPGVGIRRKEQSEQAEPAGGPVGETPLEASPQEVPEQE
jgi:hypothetical protein